MKDYGVIYVLQVLGCLDRGGAETMVMNLYHNIDISKVQFGFVVHTNKKGAYDDEVKRMGGKIYRAPKYRIINHFQYVNWWKCFYKIHKEYKIVHAHIRSSSAIFLAIAKKMGYITIAHSHSTSNGKGIYAIIKDILQLPIRYIADYLFSCSDDAGRWLYGSKVTKRTNYKMIPNCIDCKQFRYSEVQRKRIRKEQGIREDCFVVGHIGRFHEAKNHKYMIKIFVEILNKKPDTMFLLVGDGELRERIEKECVTLDIREQVIFTGLQFHPEQFYQAMDLFLFPSLWEGLPMSVVEAQASGLPCIISDRITKNVQITDLVQYKSLNENPKEWAEAVLKYEKRVRIGLDEHQQIKLKRFDSTFVAEELQKFYLKLDGRKT